MARVKPLLAYEKTLGLCSNCFVGAPMCVALSNHAGVQGLERLELNSQTVVEAPARRGTSGGHLGSFPSARWVKPCGVRAG